MKKAIIIISILILAGVAIGWYLIARNKYHPPVWKTTMINKDTITINVTATGSLSAVTTVQVGAQVSGIVSQLFVDFDSVVKKNQVIAQLDTTLLYSAMQDAIATVEKIKVQVEYTRRQFVRADTLHEEKVASQADYDLAYSNYKAAQADLMAAIASLDHEKTNLRYATIKAPINGTVISRNVDVGQTVISSFNSPTLFTIANDLKQMQVLANVDEADIGQIKTGQATLFTVDAYPFDVFKGVVSQIRLQPVMVQNVNNYIVVINVSNAELKLLPGLTANITIRVQQHANVLKVVANSIHFMPSADYLRSIKYSDSMIDHIASMKIPGNEVPKPGNVCYVWRKKGVDISPIGVKVGIFDGTFIEIEGDIKEGDELITGLLDAQTTTSTTNNPFMPKMPSRRGIR